MDDKLKSLIEELGAAISNSISESRQIAKVIATIKSSGYDVVMLLNATIAIKACMVEPLSLPALTNGAVESKFNAQDIKYLKSLHITVSG